MKYVLLIVPALMLVLCDPSHAQDSPASAAANSNILNHVGIDQKLGAVVPADLVFTDEQGRDVWLGDVFSNRPAVLVLVYYDCPMLCTMVLNDLLRSIRSMPETVGKDFDIITVSFDPRDTPALAALKKKTYLAQYNRPEAEIGWHFLTGQQPNIDALTHSVGFRYVWDAKFQVFAHASGIMVLTPGGKISRYFYGIDYAPKDLRVALTEASDGHVGGLADAVLLYCFCYDPATGKYGLAVSRLLETGGVLTVLVLGCFIVTALRRERRPATSM